jgi:signal transduction histidine kinase
MFRKEVRKIFRTLFSQVSPNGAKHYESVLMTKNGEEKLFAFTHTLIRVPGKKAAQILISAEDTTELHKTREQVEHSHLLASLGEMTAGIAHEVNNPLGSILLYSELLLASDVPPQVKKDLKIIHEEAKRATKIMTDLLIYGRRTKPQVRRVNLNGLVKKVLEMRRYQHKVQNIKVTVQLADAPLYVKGDSSQLMQVFMNIVLNAEDALREHKGGSIIVNTQANTRWAKVLISDDGPGIPEDLINQIFYPFFTTKPIGEGTGLGLSICYGIVTAHNGLIRAENNTMGGATFVVELPLLTHRAGKMGNGNGKKNYNADKRKDGKIVDRK